MIIYITDRDLEILAHASTTLPDGYRVFEDKTVESVETGTNTFECTISYTDDDRTDIENAVQVGNYVLKQSARGDDESNYDAVYQIIETEHDTLAHEIHLYAEDAGLDLLNTLCPAVELNGTLYSMLDYFVPSDWVINLIDTPTGTRSYTWDGESTATERILSVANLFDCEVYYSFYIDRLQVEERIVNVTEKRGTQEATAQLRLNFDVNNIRTTKSIADLVTALRVTGGTPEGSETPINLVGYNYSYTDPATGDVYRVDTATGQMRNVTAMSRWASAIDTDGLWLGSFEFDTTDKAVLAGQARAQLQRESQVAVNYEVDFSRLPDDIAIGDRVNIIDEHGELYLEARLLEIETCEANDTKTAVIGEYLLRDSGINAQVAELASALANQRETDKALQESLQIISDTVDAMFTLEVDSDVVLNTAYLTARLLKGNKDIKTEYDPTWFKWILRSEDGERLLGRGYTLTADMNIIGYASTILCRFIRPQLYDLTDHNLVAITDHNLDPIQVSFAGIYNQPVVTRNLLKSKLKTLRATPTVEVGDPNLTREVNLYEKDGLHKSMASTVQYFWNEQTGEFAGAHITEKPQDEFKQDPENGGANLVIRATNLGFRDGTKDLATFGADGAQIGQVGETHTVVDYHSLQLINKEGDAYFYVSDLRDKSGKADIYMRVVGDGSTQNFLITPPAIDTTYEVYVDGELASPNKSTGVIYFSTAPSKGSVIEIYYTTEGVLARALTFGTRKTNSSLGASSVVMGQECEASGYLSFATGSYSEAIASEAIALGAGAKAIGRYSFAEGFYTQAKGKASHAEGSATIADGDYTHAEGNLTATNGEGAHAEGKFCYALADYAHAQNYNTSAGYPYQTAMGRYNANSSANLLEVGNGTSSQRKNALELNANGNLIVAGTLTQSSDRRLKEHRAYLGDDAVEFIDKLKPVHFIKDSQSHVGFYAQDVEEADKWNCMTGEMNGFKTLGYTEIIAPLVAYVQKLEKRIEELEKGTE